MATPIPKNDASFTLAEIVAATGGELVRAGEPRWAQGVSTDSRAVTPGELFVAIRGERFDGHDHTRMASERGATAFVVSREVDVPASCTVVRVRDTLRALGDLGGAHRARWARTGMGTRRTTIAVTGSAGKTTTRYAVGKVLAELGARAHTSTGNLNNAVGVPMTLFGLKAEHQYAVVEIGMNQPGEIQRGAEIVRPDAAAVTLVADAHTEGVGSIWGVLREKSDIFAYLGERGIAIANADDDMARATLARAGDATRILYGQSADADVRLLGRRALGLRGNELSIEVRRGRSLTRIETTVPLLGRAGVYSSLATIAILCGLGVPGSEDGATLSTALAALQGNEPGRLAAREREDGAIVIDDAYNANPASMRASIEAAKEIADAAERRLVLVLGSMHELGGDANKLHEEVGRAAAATGARLVLAVGEAARALGQGAQAGGATVVYASDAAEAEKLTADTVFADDVVLVKASNSLGLQHVASRLLDRKRGK